MPLDSDVSDADSHLHVEFYVNQQDPNYLGMDFIRIAVPGDRTSIMETPVTEYYKSRFPRQYLYFQMNKDPTYSIGTPLIDWHKAAPDEFNVVQMGEMQILKFSTVEQIATATDAQLQRIGMGAAGLRERAKRYLDRKGQQAGISELEQARSDREAMQAQIDMLRAEMASMTKRGPGRPRKEEDVHDDDAATGAAMHE
jgi:hypothetical protein